jgi:hypothetical protein
MAELDHIFLLVKDPTPLLAQLSALGLKESSRREHPGQGTRNVCFAFDNAYFEVLWIHAPSDTLRPEIARCRFQDRAREGCPVGIAWRGELALPTWRFTPPYLPKGLHIPVATDSDSIEQPFVFRSPGTQAPKDWPAERRGPRQPWKRIVLGSLGLRAPASPTVTLLQERGLIEAHHQGHGLVLRFEGGDPDQQLVLGT